MQDVSGDLWKIDLDKPKSLVQSHATGLEDGFSRYTAVIVLEGLILYVVSHMAIPFGLDRYNLGSKTKLILGRYSLIFVDRENEDIFFTSPNIGVSKNKESGTIHLPIKEICEETVGEVDLRDIEIYESESLPEHAPASNLEKLGPEATFLERNAVSRVYTFILRIKGSRISLATDGLSWSVKFGGMRSFATKMLRVSYRANTRSLGEIYMPEHPMKAELVI